MSTTNRATSTKRFRVRRATVAVLVALTTLTASCTPGQIEDAFTQIATPFESGYDFEASVSGLLFSAGLVLSYLTAGLGLGPGLP